jgi:hypothetical protein
VTLLLGDVIGHTERLLGHAERAHILIEKGPVATVAAVFLVAFISACLACGALVILLLRTKDRHAEALMELTVDTKAVLLRFVAVEEGRRRRDKRVRPEPAPDVESSGYFEAIPKPGKANEET